MNKEIVIRYDKVLLVKAARMIKSNCRKEETCSPLCAFWDTEEAGCIFKKRNKHHDVVDPEDWEV